MNQTGLREEVITSIRLLAKTHGVSKVVLFGSRARGDYGRSSDIDLAVQGGNVMEFAIDAEEEVPTLLTFDVVDLTKDISQSLLESIEREGVLLYEKI